MLLFQYYPNICQQAARVVGDEDVARDLVLEVILAAQSTGWIHLSQGKLRSFLVWRTGRACNEHLRKSRQREFRCGNIFGACEAFWGDAEGSGYDLEMIRLLDQAIAGMPRQARRVMELSRQGLETAEIADILGLRPQTVRNTRWRGMDFLRRRLGDHGGAGEVRCGRRLQRRSDRRIGRSSLFHKKYSGFQK